MESEESRYLPMADDFNPKHKTAPHRIFFNTKIKKVLSVRLHIGINTLDERCILLANELVDGNLTVRAVAKKFGISKSTVHKDLTSRLVGLNPTLYEKVKKVLEINKDERHIRGGMATKKKYKQS